MLWRGANGGSILGRGRYLTVGAVGQSFTSAYQLLSASHQHTRPLVTTPDASSPTFTGFNTVRSKMATYAYADALDEWEAGCFYDAELMSDAFMHVLSQLPVQDFEENPVDPRLGVFLEEGYGSYLEHVVSKGTTNPLVHIALTMAKKMIGHGVTTRSQARRKEEVSSVETGGVPACAEPMAPSPSPQPPPPDVCPAAVVNPWRPWQAGNPSDVAARMEVDSQNGSAVSDTPTSGSSRKRERAISVTEEENETDGPTIEILESGQRHIARFKSDFREEVFRISGLGDSLSNLESQIVNLFDTMLERQREAVSARNEDTCFVEVRSNESSHKPIFFSLRRSDQINGQVILDKISSVLNSNESFLTDGALYLSYTHIPVPEAGGRGVNRGNETFRHWIVRKAKAKRNASLFDPENSDSMCLTRSVAFLKLHLDCSKNPEKRGKLNRFKQPMSIFQKKDAIELCQNAGIDPEMPCGLPEIHKLQDSLPQYRIVVYLDQKGKEIVFKGPRSTLAQPRQGIYLLWHEAHFYGVLSVTGLFGESFFCEDCLVLYRHKNDHKCGGCCLRCYSNTCHNDLGLPLIRCNDCARYFSGQECFNFHKNEKVHPADKTTCEVKKFCPKCEKFFTLGGRGVSKISEHKCRHQLCSNCKLYLPENHKCYMAPWAPKELSNKIRYMRIYFDIETTQSDQYEGKNNWLEHKPNLIICHKVCNACESEKDKDHYCVKCGTREYRFDSIESERNVTSDFIDLLFGLCSSEKTEIQVYAHNARSFDNYFIIQELLSRKKKPKVILQGAKIISMKLGNVHFKDSLLFLPQKLSALPKAFGLNELKKGYFPHLANRKEFYDYVGPMVDRDLYCTSYMTDKDKLDFNAWYDEQVDNNYLFNFKQEIFDYCQSDVEILRNSMEQFRTLFMDIAGFDPLHNCLTLSSACMAMYRLNHLPLYSIGMVPRGGYRGRDKQSFLALKWLDYEQHKLGNTFKIQTSENGREVKVMGRPVDGFSTITKDDGSVENKIWQFHGCLFHLCDRCHKDTVTREKLKKKFGDDKFEKTKKQTEMFRRNGFTVVEKWECDFNHELHHDADTRVFFENYPTKRSTPLKLRDSLCGGRTSALYSYRKADLSKGEQIRFFDVCSEYPFANFKKGYVHDHPEIFLENDLKMPPINEWNGVIKCTVLPPQNLFLPVLPFKSCSKLMFPLCRSCCEAQNQNDCSHDNPEDRCLTGTWCAPELHLALQKGYKIMKVHEVYQYPGVKKFNPKTKEDGLFSGYVRVNMAMKIEASGWPQDVTTDEQKNDFIRDIFERDGIVISKDKVVKNPGKRFLAKLILNSFWGKMGERCTRSGSLFIDQYSELIALINDSTITIDSVVAFGEECLQINYTPVADMEESLPTTSIVHASFTTAHGRMVLYEALDIVGERALYHDTGM